MSRSVGSPVSAGLVAVLFTDVVASTELWSRLGDDRADDVRRRLRSASDRVVATSHGTVVKDLGDGVMATFPTASACIDAAVELQRVSGQIGRAGGVPDLRIRVGASIGEATHDDGDWFGPPVIEAARLCAVAEPSQILVHESVALMARRAEHEARPVGLTALKGLPEPVPVREIAWIAAEGSIVLPPMLQLADNAPPFVGRSDALGRLQRARSRMAAEHFVVVSGEPGAGKTRLVSEFASDWATSGGAVVGTWFNETGDSFTRSTTRLVRQLVELLPPPNSVGPLLDALTGLGARPGGEVEPAEVGDALAAWVAAAAVDHPMLVVLDDLHWAPAPSLAMLEAFLESIGNAPALVIATYRDTDLGRSHPLGDWLASRRRDSRPERIDLHGLALDDLVGLLSGGAAQVHPQVRALAESLYRETEGNAFFVVQMIEHLRETGFVLDDDGETRVVQGGDRLGLPQGVRELVGRRLRLLPPGCDEVLAVAAVQGRMFSVAVSTRVLGATTQVVERFDAATTAGLIEPVAGSLDRYQFVHALVRETVLDEITPLRRARLHLEIGRTLDELTPNPNLTARLEIARHHLEGAALGGLPRAVDLILVNETIFDITEWLTLARGAIAAADEIGLDDARFALLLARSGIAWLIDGDRDSVLADVRRAVALARSTGDAELFAEVVAASSGRASFGIDPEYFSLAEEALAGIDPNSRSGVLLRSGLAHTRSFFAPPGTDPVQEYLEAEAEAGRQGFVLIATRHFALHAASDVRTLLDRPIEDDPFRTWPLARTDLRAAQAHLDHTARATSRHRTPLIIAAQHQMQSLLAMARGELDEAGRHTDLVAAHGGGDAMYAVGVPWQHAAIALWRGDVTTARNTLAALGPFLLYPRLVALLEADLLDRAGDRDGALAAFRTGWADGPGTLGRDWTYTGTLSRLAELAARFGLADECAILEPLLVPYDGQFVLETCIELRCSVAWLLGGLAAAQGRTAEAIDHYERALAFETTNGAVLMAERTAADLRRV